jgi:hypothetical protein
MRILVVEDEAKVARALKEGLEEIEFELGYFSLQREGEDNTFLIPSAVLSYGLWRIEALGVHGWHSGCSSKLRGNRLCET